MTPEYVFRWTPVPLPPSRTSWILTLRAGSCEGKGEAAPLEPVVPPESEGVWPGETLEQALRLWPAPFSFALESALLEIRACQRGKHLRETVPEGRRVDTHAFVVTGSADLSKAWVWSPDLEEKLWKMGYRVVKAKVRTLEDVVFWVRHPPRRLRLRLDANRAFSHEDAPELLSMCRHLPLEFVEEPFGDSPEAALERLAGEVRVALDETLRDHPEAAFRWISRGWISVAVVKPALVGTMDRLRDFLGRLERTGLEIVVTHLLEGEVGRRHTLYRALLLNLSGIHGLDLGAGSPLGPSHL